MKKITIILLLAMVPFLTIAQKRSKKERSKNTENFKTEYATKASYDFMIITGYEMIDKGPKGNSEELNSPQYQIKKMVRSGGKTIVKFDFGVT